MGYGPLTREPSVAAKLYDAANSGTKAQAFAGPGNLWRMLVENNTAAAAYLQVFDLASGSVTVGSTTPTTTFMVPASGAIILDPSDFPILFFTTACTIASTTSRSNSTGASVNVKLWYKN